MLEDSNYSVLKERNYLPSNPIDADLMHLKKKYAIGLSPVSGNSPMIQINKTIENLFPIDTSSMNETFDYYLLDSAKLNTLKTGDYE